MNILTDTIMKLLLQAQKQRPCLAYSGIQNVQFDYESYGCRNECSGSCEGGCTGSCDMSCSGGCDGTFGY